MPRKKKVQDEETKSNKSKDEKTKVKPIKGETGGEEDVTESSPQTGSEESSPEVQEPTQEIESILIPCTVIYKGNIYLHTEDAPREHLEAMKNKLKRLKESGCK